MNTIPNPSQLRAMARPDADQLPCVPGRHCERRARDLGAYRGPWPPGPGEVHLIPQLANGLPGVMGGCKGYGNAIVPQVAQAFIEAVMEAQ